MYMFMQYVCGTCMCSDYLHYACCIYSNCVWMKCVRYNCDIGFQNYTYMYMYNHHMLHVIHM